MNNVEIVEWWHYKMSAPIYADDLYIIKLVKIKHWFREVDWIAYKSHDNSGIVKTMPLSEFKKKVLYKI